MRELSRVIGTVCLAVVVTACGITARDRASTPSPQGQTAPAPSTPQQKATASPANPDSAILADFNARLDNYIKLQRGLAKDTPALEETKNPGEITVAQEVLASAIRNTRKNARQGDIFTPQIASLFRRLMYPELKGADGRQTKEEIAGEAPAQVALKVNATYPASQPLQTVPGNILAALPQLPRDVEYRVVGRHLILRDVDANIIVDYMPNAIR